MTARRILPAIGLPLVLALGGCSLLPSALTPTHLPEPSRTHEVDVVELEPRMAEVFPDAPADLEVIATSGLDALTFGEGWEEHEDARLVRVVEEYLSPGWADPALGPGYTLLFELVLMDSVLAADAVMMDLAASTKEPYTFESTGPEVAQEEYAPAEPSGRWPVGTVEQERRAVWPTGERTSGWLAWGASGPFVFVVSAAAVPDEASLAAMEDFADEHVPVFLQRIEQLRADL